MNIQKLRDMNLHAVADELERLREFKSEVENQEPSGYVVIGNGIFFYRTTLEEAEYQVAALEMRGDENPTIQPRYANPVPADSQQSEPSTNVWESALLDAANAVVHANQNNTGYEPSRSLLACRIDDLREILDDANIDFPGDTDRCQSHESQQSAEVIPLESVESLMEYINEWGDDTDMQVVKSELGEMILRAKGTYGCPSHDSEQGEQP